MKKVKFSLFAIALIAICSAFATTTKTATSTVYGRDFYDGQIYTVESTDIGVTFLCDDETADLYCTYNTNTAGVLSNPNGAQDFAFIKVTE